MVEDPIKSAFSKVKEDISILKSELQTLTQEISELKRTLNPADRQSDRQTIRQIKPSDIQNNTTDNSIPTKTSTDNLSLEALRNQYSNVSTGNGGVSTDRQTDNQTDTSTQNSQIKHEKFAQSNKFHLQESQELTPKSPDFSDSEVSSLVSSLGSVKDSLESKFKSLTKQEFLVFSTIYQLENEGNKVDYYLLSNKLALSESSIRDYVQRMLKKQIPLLKLKENNKKVYLSISSNLKKLANLNTILSFRDNLQ